MFEAIKQLGFPRGILNFIAGTYETVIGLSSSGSLMFKVVPGVLQGCPLSGALFPASVDPILRHLSSIVDVPLHTEVPRTHPLPTGVIAACADDIGMQSFLHGGKSFQSEGGPCEMRDCTCSQEADTSVA